jgi:hypothetical protein
MSLRLMSGRAVVTTDGRLWHRLSGHIVLEVRVEDRSAVQEAGG